MAQVFLLALLAAAVGLLAGRVRLWRCGAWSLRGIPAVAIALVLVRLYLLIGAVGVFLQPLEGGDWKSFDCPLRVRA